MLSKKRDPRTAKKKAEGRAYTEELKSAGKPWLVNYLANKPVPGEITSISIATPTEIDNTLPKVKKNYKALYESALKRIDELEKQLQERARKKVSKRPAGFGRGPKSVVPGGQPANATRKPKKHFSRQTNPYKD